MKVIVLAEGRGTRLWPMSWGLYSKHSLTLPGDGQSLLAKAYERAKVLVEPVTRQRWMAMGSRTGENGSAKSADGSRRVYRAVKRVFDIVGAIAALIIVGPARGLVAVIIVSQSSGHGGYANTCG